MIRAKPLPYQKEGVRLIEDYGGRVLLADEMGLGKTLQVLWSLRRNPEWLPALIVCPASIKYHWQHEAITHARFQSSVCEGEKPPTWNGRDFATMAPLTIINYDILWHWLPYLKRLKFKCIILDEFHDHLGNVRTKRTKAVREISKKKNHIIAISGTPILNRPVELFPTLNILWPEDFQSYWSYGQQFCNAKWTPWGWNFKGASNRQELHRQLILHGMIRRKKSEVLKDLPDMVQRVIPCQLSDPDEYQLAATDFLGWLKKTAAHKVHTVGKAERLAKFGYLLRLAARLKLKPVVDWANQFLRETDQKLVLFAVHRKAIDVLQRRIDFPSVVVDGSVTGRMRQAAVDQFQKDKKTRLFIGNIKAAGVGLTLTAASELGFVEFSHRPMDHAQAAARIHRISQKSTAFINYFTAGGTIEEDLCERLMKKQETINIVVDGGHDEDEFNLYEELIELIEGRLI